MPLSNGAAALRGQESHALAGSPADRLMKATLEQALTTFRQGLGSRVPRRRQRYFEVRRWFASQESDWIYSFENICATLRIDPDDLRARLRGFELAAHAARVLSGSGSPYLSVSPRRRS